MIGFPKALFGHGLLLEFPQPQQLDPHGRRFVHGVRILRAQKLSAIFLVFELVAEIIMPEIAISFKNDVFGHFQTKILKPP